MVVVVVGVEVGVGLGVGVGVEVGVGVRVGCEARPGAGKRIVRHSSPGEGLAGISLCPLIASPYLSPADPHTQIGATRSPAWPKAAEYKLALSCFPVVIVVGSPTPQYRCCRSPPPFMSVCTALEAKSICLFFHTRRL